MFKRDISFLACGFVTLSSPVSEQRVCQRRVETSAVVPVCAAKRIPKMRIPCKLLLYPKPILRRCSKGISHFWHVGFVTLSSPVSEQRVCQCRVETSAVVPVCAAKRIPKMRIPCKLLLYPKPILRRCSKGISHFWHVGFVTLSSPVSEQRVCQCRVETSSHSKNEDPLQTPPIS